MDRSVGSRTEIEILLIPHNGAQCLDITSHRLLPSAWLVPTTANTAAHLGRQPPGSGIDTSELSDGRRPRRAVPGRLSQAYAEPIAGLLDREVPSRQDGRHSFSAELLAMNQKCRQTGGAGGLQHDTKLTVSRSHSFDEGVIFDQQDVVNDARKARYRVRERRLYCDAVGYGGTR